VVGEHSSAVPAATSTPTLSLLHATLLSAGSYTRTGNDMAAKPVVDGALHITSTGLGLAVGMSTTEERATSTAGAANRAEESDWARALTAAPCALHPAVPHWPPPIAMGAVRSVGAELVPRTVCKVAAAAEELARAELFTIGESCANASRLLVPVWARTVTSLGSEPTWLHTTLTTTKVGSFVVPERGRFMLPAVLTGPSNEKTAFVRTALQTAVVVLGPKDCGPGTNSLTHCDDQLVVTHIWVVGQKIGAAVGLVVKEATPENVTNCGEATTVFVSHVGWATTRALAPKAARRSTSPPRASVYVDALVISIPSHDSSWTGK
jgi:hypothetical protein